MARRRKAITSPTRKLSDAASNRRVRTAESNAEDAVPARLLIGWNEGHVSDPERVRGALDQAKLPEQHVNVLLDMLKADPSLAIDQVIATVKRIIPATRGPKAKLLLDKKALRAALKAPGKRRVAMKRFAQKEGISESTVWRRARRAKP